MEIRKIRIDQINPAPYNPRIDLKPGDPRYEKIKCSIKGHGLVYPLVWNSRTGNLVAGHQRLKILRELGCEEVYVRVVDVPLEVEKSMNLALNSEYGDWDDNKLASLLEEFSYVPDFDFTTTGFSVSEISEILDAHRMPDAEDDFDAEAAVKAIEQPITEPGELIQLGDHRILCGDSGNYEDLENLMENEKANQYDGDLPYNVGYLGGDHPNPNTRPKKSRKWDKIYSDDMPQEEYESWMRKIFTNIKNFLHLGSAIYVWQGHRQFPPMYQILLDLGFHISCVILWLKPSVAFSYGDYSFQTEQCLYGWLEGAAHYFAGAPGESNVWEIKRDPTKNYLHPTQKPVALRQRSVKNSSKRGDIVLDTFLGSGSILLACESLGRRCYGIEIDPKYCDVAIRRFIAFAPDKVSSEIKRRYMKEESK